MNIFVLVLSMCVVAATGAAQDTSDNRSAPGSLQTASTAPDSLPSVQALTFKQLKEVMKSDSGRIVLVNTWASWCKPCREEMPALLRLKKEFADEDFKLIVLSADEPDDLEKEVRPMLRKLQVDFPSYIMDEKQETFMSAMNPEWNGALALPTTYVYDKQGKLVDMMVGGKEYEKFKETVTKLMAK